MGNKQARILEARSKAIAPVQSMQPATLHRASLDAVDYSATSYDHRSGPYSSNPSGGYSLKMPETGFSSRISGCLLGSQPQPFSLYFNCVRCGEACYDGGLCKIVICACGIAQQRDIDNHVSIADMSDDSDFKTMFIRTTSAPQHAAELQTLTLGLFVDQPEEQFVSFDLVMTTRLLPYFSQRQRCVAKDELFCIGQLKFKVMACYPLAGLVNAGTQLQCYTVLQTRPLTKVHLLPVRPSVIDERNFRRRILPYMNQNTVHLHKEQSLNIAGLQLIIVAIEPANGIVTTATELFFEGDPLVPIRCITVMPQADNLPVPLQRLSQERMREAMYHMFLMPFFVGWSRVVQANQQVEIEGVRLVLQSSQPGFGVMTENSRIVYDGSLLERPLPILLPHSLRNILGGRQLRASGDPRVDLIQHIMFIQQLLSNMELREDEGTASVVMSQLPVYKLTSVPSSEERKRCLVCMEDYAVGEEVKTLPCFHVFHTICIDQWLSRSKLCPFCKTPSDQISS